MRTSGSIVSQIIGLIQADAMRAGTHLPAQALADRLRVSRSPVNQSLSLLAAKGVLRREPNRGYFLVAPITVAPSTVEEALGLKTPDIVTETYFRIADERLRGKLPDVVPESLIRLRYGLTPAQLNAVLGRIAGEGWIEKKPGYGWEFSSTLTRPDSLLQSYRLRLALEPAALLEPGYRLEPHVVAHCRAAERRLLEGAIETDGADSLRDRGVRFHESLVEGSGNAFFIDTLRRVNRLRRLLSYRALPDRSRLRAQCRQHLHLLDLLERGRNQEASEAMREHLAGALRPLRKTSAVLKR